MAARRRALKLFLDSSVVFTAANSPFGGSAKLFTLHDIELYVSKVVLHEVEKNVRKKLQLVQLSRFFRLVEQVIVLKGVPTERQIQDAECVIVEKDSVILADFCRSSCDYLITLDKQDFLQESVFQFVAPKKILTPKMFFELLDVVK